MNLIEQCKDRIKWDKEHNIKPPYNISLVVKGNWTKSGRKKLFNLPNSPVGDIISEVDRGKLLVCFNAEQVLMYAQMLQNIKDKMENNKDNNFKKIK
jgi:hypothetical protein